MKARALLFVIALSSSAWADEIRHTVKAGESCGSIAQRYYGDSRFVDLLHGANPELGKKPPPHVLTEGMVLIIPAKPATGSAPDAQLTAVTNQVDVLTPEKKAGKANDPLFRGNRVSTAAQSAADVTFRDETQVKLGERTLVVILGDSRSAAQKTSASSETELVTGELRAFMAGPKKPATTTVGTDAATVKVHSGEAQVTNDAQKTTRVAVYGGSSTIDAHGAVREVTRGFGSKAELGKQPTVPHPLPSAPTWSSAPPLVLYDSTKATIVGEYEVPETVGEWRVQIARDGIFRDIAVDTRTPAAVRRLEVQPPGPGRYYVRVAAVDAEHFEGPWSRVMRVMVVDVKESSLSRGRRQLSISPPDAFCVRVGNVTLSRIEGLPIVAERDEPVRIRCAPSESDPTTLKALDPSSL